MNIDDYGAIMRLARRAGSLAYEDSKTTHKVKDKIELGLILYTDDPCAAGVMAHEADMAAVCGVSEIVNVCITNGPFPPAAKEVDRLDPELPRIAALWLYASGSKCPRCRIVKPLEPIGLCKRCDDVVTELDRTAA